MRSRLQERFQSAVRELLAEAGCAAAPPAFSLEVPRSAEHGDFACNAALLLAKPLQRPPRQIAERLTARGIRPPQIDKITACTNCGNCMIYCPDMAIVVRLEEMPEAAAAAHAVE